VTLPNQLPTQQYGPHPLAPPPQVQHNGVTLLVAYAGRVAPVITTSTALALARIWHEQGAAHSVGNMVLMVALSGGAFAAATVSAIHRNSEPITTAVAFTAAGAFAAIGPAAYTESWALATLIWLVATVLVYLTSARHWRAARQAREEREHELALARLDSYTQIEGARITTDARTQALAYGLMFAEAAAHRRHLDPTTYDPAALQRAGLPELPGYEADITRDRT
jgi:hypothetical protein